MKMTARKIRSILKDISFGDWEFHILTKGDGFLLQIRFWGADNFKGGRDRQHCRKWYISSHAVKAEVVRCAWKAVEAAVIHEAQERFRYKGRAIFNPHLDPDSLAEIHSFDRRKP